MPENTTGRTRTHLATGLRVHGDRENVWSAEVSLPRLLLVSNGRLIATADQLRQAFAKLWELLAQVASRPRITEFVRVDLCWQFAGKPALFVAAHAAFLYPGVRGMPAIRPGESLTWGKGQSELKVKLYDKSAEMRCRVCNVVRLEFLLRGRRLRREFNGDLRPIDDLNLWQCYRVFRKLALQLQPKAIARPKGIAGFLAVADRAGWQENGVSAFDLWTHDKTAKTTRTLRQQIARQRVEMYGVDWVKLFPEDTLPDVVEVRR